VGGLPPSPEQRDKAVPLGKGVKPAYRAGNYRELEAPKALSRWGALGGGLDSPISALLATTHHHSQ
jgi:hypothetical protein